MVKYLECFKNSQVITLSCAPLELLALGFRSFLPGRRKRGFVTKTSCHGQSRIHATEHGTKNHQLAHPMYFQNSIMIELEMIEEIRTLNRRVR